MENINGMQIRVEGNSVKFVTPSGVTYFKKLDSFKEALLKGQKVFNAPLSAEKPSTIAAVETVAKEVMKA